MPTETFFNLPKEKKQRIIDAAIDEFADHPYKSASIARIIKMADIPRGSFYQYFDDIKDLYKYIFDITGEKKIKYFHSIMAQMDELKTIEVIKLLYVAGIEFGKNHPKLAAIANKFNKEDESIKKEILGGFEGKSSEIYEHILRKGQEKGEIDPNIDIEIAAYMFFALNTTMFDYFNDGDDYDTLFANTDELFKKIDKMLYIIMKGIEK